MRKDLARHLKEEVEQHLILTKDDATQAKKQLQQMKGKMELLQKGVIEATDDLVEYIATQPLIPTVPVIIRMAQFSEFKECNQVWTSPSFSAYINEVCVTMCLKVYANGDDESNHKYMSVELHVIDGGRDLDFFERTNFDVRLLSQSDVAGSHVATIKGGACYCIVLDASKPIEDRYTKYGSYSRYLRHRHLRTNSSYLKNDCLNFKVSYHKEEH